MKNRFFKILVTMLTLIVASSFFVACDDEGTEKKYDYLVTFDYNVGNLGEGFESQYLGVKNGSVVAIKPGYSDAYKEAALKGYYIEGWYTAKTDSEGKVMVGDDGRVVFDKKWDFERDTVSSDITLYANFVQKATLIITGGDKDVVYNGLAGKSEKIPDLIDQPKKAGYTFLGYYTDETYEEEFAWPYVYQEGETKYVYARFIEGVWDIVSTPEQFTAALSAKKNIYLTADLDFTGKKWASGITYNGEIAGNGHTITGVSVKIEAVRTSQQYAGLFGALGSSAYLHDLTIENVQVSFTDGGFMSPFYKVSMLSTKLEEGSRLTNVTVSGVLTQGSLVPNSAVEYYKVTSNDQGATLTDCNFEGITIPQNI